MPSLKEIKNVRQVPGEPLRRWFTSPGMDLFVWLDDSGAIGSFQLSYDKGRAEHAITWKRDSGFLHTAVDDGEMRGGKHKAAPILAIDGRPNIERIVGRVSEQGIEVPVEIVEFVSARLREFPEVS